ncbi:MAG TPA: hypothetical protein VN685_02015 [Rhizomicrobium sp.]|nr:hypothetical protein [Rhizomicrobium sp.]
MNKAISAGLAGLIFLCAFALHASAQPSQTAKTLTAFKEVADLLAIKGASKSLSPEFCARFELDCGGQPWPVKLESAANEKEQKNAAITNVAGRDIVLLVRQDLDRAKGEFYVCDPSGNFIRGYLMVSNRIVSRLTADQAPAGFEAEKKWWMDWLPTHVGASAPGP